MKMFWIHIYQRNIFIQLLKHAQGIVCEFARVVYVTICMHHTKEPKS